MTLGAVALALHYNKVIEKIGNVPVPMLIGKPCSAKTTAIGVAMATLGIMDSQFGIYFHCYFSMQHY